MKLKDIRKHLFPKEEIKPYMSADPVQQWLWIKEHEEPSKSFSENKKEEFVFDVNRSKLKEYLQDMKDGRRKIYGSDKKLDPKDPDIQLSNFSEPSISRLNDYFFGHNKDAEISSKIFRLENDRKNVKKLGYCPEFNRLDIRTDMLLYEIDDHIRNNPSPGFYTFIDFVELYDKSRSISEGINVSHKRTDTQKLIISKLEEKIENNLLKITDNKDSSPLIFIDDSLSIANHVEIKLDIMHDPTIDKSYRMIYDSILIALDNLNDKITNRSDNKPSWEDRVKEYSRKAENIIQSRNFDEDYRLAYNKIFEGIERSIDIELKEIEKEPADFQERFLKNALRLAETAEKISYGYDIKYEIDRPYKMIIKGVNLSIKGLMRYMQESKDSQDYLDSAEKIANLGKEIIEKHTLDYPTEELFRTIRKGSELYDQSKLVMIPSDLKVHQRKNDVTMAVVPKFRDIHKDIAQRYNRDKPQPSLN